MKQADHSHLPYATLSDKGLVRHQNEDFIGLSAFCQASELVPESLLCILCDGVGGHLGGETASRLAVEEISAYIGGEHPETFGTLWTTHFRLEDRSWAVVQRVALFPLQEETVALDSLGLDPARRYAAFDFWEERVLGIVQGSLPLRQLCVGDTQLCALTPLEGDAPVLIGSNRHVSMDSVSVTGYRREGDTLTLALHGVVGEAFRYWVYMPAPCTVEADVPVAVLLAGEVVCVTVQFVKETATVAVRPAKR